MTLRIRAALMLIPTVSLLLKAPREGHVKTRLAREIGFPAATRAYRRLVEHQLREIPADWPTHIHFTPSGDELQMRAWLGFACEYSPQSEGDLGERLAQAMRMHFAAHATPLIFIGGDCPYLDRACFAAVAKTLQAADAALLPARDGGYCLLGIRRAEEHLFSKIAWSTETVADETRERLREAAMTWEELEPLEDVDNQASWERALARFPHLSGSPGEPG